VAKPNRKLERLVGTGGAVFAGPWVFFGVCRLIDWVGRAQTTVAITPHLGILATPQAFVLELIGAVGLLYYATTLEHSREAVDAPRVILAYSSGPEEPKRHWFWLKVAISVCAISCVAAGLAFLLIRHYSVRSPPQMAKATVIPLIRSDPNHPTETKTHQRSYPLQPSRSLGAIRLYGNISLTQRSHKYHVSIWMVARLGLISKYEGQIRLSLAS